MFKETINTVQASTQYICPVHGKIGDEWNNSTLRVGNPGLLHCVACLGDLLDEKLPVVEERKRDA